MTLFHRNQQGRGVLLRCMPEGKDEALPPLLEGFDFLPKHVWVRNPELIDAEGRPHIQCSCNAAEPMDRL
ncbi:hypothetical protein SDC9_49105 [bioreactor metagenome]|uniref:Uncharacterized protein n=1 Tax=bioreactor metagenome TaxID=1076179 RepID=A0A644WGH6_9ZZZZ